MNARIDLNLDAGESAAALADGREAALYEWVTSVNIACGGHAGDHATMSRAVELALKQGLAIGAHPSYPDRSHFGRRRIKITHEELVDSLREQLTSLRRVCDEQGAQLTHVKPHGALYNTAANDRVVAQAVMESVVKFDPQLRMMGLAGSPFLNWCSEKRFMTLAEGFPDRRYETDGSLRSREHSDALIEDPLQAGRQAVELVHSGVQTLCLHGDEPRALDFARAVSTALQGAGVQIVSYLD